MGWFSNVTDFLSSPGFRIGAGIAGLASGAGAFGDMGGWGTALQGLSGAANLAAGAASTFGPNRSALDRATGALQLGLGGYNVGQSAGAVGSFSDVWNQISGGDSASSAAPAAAPFSQDDWERNNGVVRWGGLGSTPETTPVYPNFSYTGPPAPDSAFGRDTGIPPFSFTGGGGGETITSSLSDVGPQYAQIPGMPPEGTPGVAPEDLFPAPAAAPAPVPPPDAAPTPAPGTQDLPVQGTPGRIGGGATTPTPAGGPPAVTPPAVAAPSPNMTARIINPGGALASAGAAPVQGDWLDRAWNNLLTTAEKNPVAAGMQALQIGSMLTGLFAQSRADIARDAMAGMDPNSPNGAEFRRLYEERARREIESQAATVRSSLEAKFAARGMLRSTVYTNAVQSLEESRIKLLGDLPLTSLNAWNQTPQGSGRALTAGATFAQSTSTPTDFSSISRVLGQSPFTQQLAANAQRA